MGSGVSDWIEAIIEENFKPCDLDQSARSAVGSLLAKYNERLVRDALEKDWLTQNCESYANPMID